MENNDLLKSQLEIHEVAASYLSDTAKWGKFLAITGFVFCGLFVLLGLFFSTIFSSFGLYGTAFSGLGPAVGSVYILISLLYFFPCLFLFRFSTKMKVALATSDQETLNEAFNQHRRMYKFVGILMVILIGFYALILIFGLLAAVFR